MSFPSSGPIDVQPTPRELVRAGWAPLAVVVSHALWAELVGHSMALDLVMHPLGGAAIAYCLHRACLLARPFLGELTVLGHHLLVLALATSAATTWELVEFLSDVFVGTTIQTDIVETMVDLALGIGAATLVVATLWWLAPSAGQARRMSGSS